jgi:homoserine dehydrogenase
VLLPIDHPFAQASGPENVVRVVARDAGTLVLRGAGAGGAATASSILGDVVSSLRSLSEGHNLKQSSAHRFEPALEVAPLYDRLPRIHELPRYPRWDDHSLQAPASQAPLAYAWPGKGSTP